MTRCARLALTTFLNCAILWGQTDSNHALEKQIDRRNKNSSGIYVSEPQVFDDSLLQQMLGAAENRLASMQALDTSGVTGKLGATTGGQLTANGFALNLQAPSLKAPPAAAAPTPTTSLPSSFGVSSSNILNEQMQLSYEIANLRLLLEGSLSDRFLKSDQYRIVKPRTTIGFSVALTPRYRDAVAILEVEVTKGEDLGRGEPPVVTALLPREKTYNVASIRESNLSLGAGAATQVFGISGSFLHGSKTYYLVQDQDTVALPIPSAAEGLTVNKEKTAFQWEFRPVLGRHYVAAGMRQTFVQLAFPSSRSAPSFGNVSVRSYWRRYDQGRGLLGKVIAGSLREQYLNVAIPNLAIEVAPKGFNATDLEDLGNGQMLVRLHQQFLADTTVRVGSHVLTKSPGGLAFTHNGIEFVAPISELATERTVLLARDGSEIPLVIEELRNKPAPTVATLDISSLDDSNSLVTVTFSDPSHLNDKPPLVFVIGDRVFGYRDAPFSPTAGKSLRAIVPTALLTKTQAITIKPLFAPPGYSVTRSLDLTPFGQQERIVLLEQSKQKSTYLLLGSRLSRVAILSPKNATFLEGPDDETLRRFELSADQAKTEKQILIRRASEHPVLVALPGDEAKEPQTGGERQDDSHKQSYGAVQKGLVPLNADEATFTGTDFANLDKVIFNGKVLQMEVAKDGKLVLLKGLKANRLTSKASNQVIQFVYKAAVAPVILEVVADKAEEKSK